MMETQVIEAAGPEVKKPGRPKRQPKFKPEPTVAVETEKAPEAPPEFGSAIPKADERQKATTDQREKLWQRVRKIMEEDCQMVTGIFRNHECPGQAHQVVVTKYPGLHYNETFQDGGTYTVPKYIARHLNGIDKASAVDNGLIHSCQKAIHEWRVNKADMSPHTEIGRYTQRFSFQPQGWIV
jgi:hypothetical protein